MTARTISGHETSVQPLSGRQVLVVEDEYFIADEIAAVLTAHGADVIGPFADLDLAEQALRAGPPHLAILDIDLRGKRVFPLARTLRHRKVPFIFSSGYDRLIVPDEFRDVPLWEKPLEAKFLALALSELLRRHETSGESRL